MIDLLCGGLSGGGIGDQVKPLFGPPNQPYGSSCLFLAVRVGHFADLAIFQSRARDAVGNASSVRRAPGVERVFAPGELAYDARSSAEGWCRLATPTVMALREAAQSLGVDLGGVFREGN
jgi:LDH2 family malate/lactate/ureidoglycolate dehydrogenase